MFETSRKKKDPHLIGASICMLKLFCYAVSSFPEFPTNLLQNIVLVLGQLHREFSYSRNLQLSKDNETLLAENQRESHRCRRLVGRGQEGGGGRV